jgi:class 3 adenylate cyclase
LEFKHLEVRVGVHTGKIIAGLIGTKLVKYDIFGEDVLKASKIRVNAPMSSMCVSEETMNLLAKNPKVYKNYEFEEIEPFEFNQKSIKKFKTTFMVKDETESEERS